MPIIPETKSWTWILERPCPECGFDTRPLGTSDLAPLFADQAERWPAILAGRDRSQLRQRPSDDRWAPLEYACHVRDVFRLGVVRLTMLLEKDDAVFANWDQDATAEEDAYLEQDPAVVAKEISSAAVAVADLLHQVPTEGWQRSGRRSDGARFSVHSFSRYLIHDPIHHLWDVDQQLNGR
jgi:hypothetical protein